MGQSNSTEFQPLAFFLPLSYSSLLTEPLPPLSNQHYRLTSPLAKNSWDDAYATELTNHAANPQEEGTVWFDDSDAEAKVVDFLENLSSSSSPPSSSAEPTQQQQQEHTKLDKATTTFLDLGCGNGSLLLALREAGWRARLLGVDYSEASVALARRVAAARRVDGYDYETNAKEDEEEDTVDFAVWDVLTGPLDAVLLRDDAGDPMGWDVVLDKGTFDAVSLSDERDTRGRRICEGYRERVLSLLAPRGMFLVTSCNWTEAELKGWFEGGESEGEDAARLKEMGRIQYPSFSFGGVKGQTISTLCFMKI